MAPERPPLLSSPSTSDFQPSWAATEAVPGQRRLLGTGLLQRRLGERLRVHMHACDGNRISQNGEDVPRCSDNDLGPRDCPQPCPPCSKVAECPGPPPISLQSPWAAWVITRPWEGQKAAPEGAFARVVVRQGWCPCQSRSSSTLVCVCARAMRVHVCAHTACVCVCV